MKQIRELQEETRELINRFAAVKGLSKNELSKQLDVSGATLSHIENGHVDKLTESMLLKIKNKLDSGNNWTLVRTSNFLTIEKICNEARRTKRMYGIIGYSGAGKTTALSVYYKNHPDTYLITCKKTMSPKQFFIQLLKVLGIQFTGTIYDIIERIANELNSKKDAVVLIDEAGKLSHTILLYLHDLRDWTENTTGIVLAGVEYFKSNLRKAVERQKEGIPELFNRIGFWQELNAPTPAEIEKICEVNGIADESQSKKIVLASNDYRNVNTMVLNIKQGLV